MSFLKSIFGRNPAPPRRQLDAGSAVEELYNCIQTRPRPEDVTETILDIVGVGLSSGERARIDRAARNSLRRNAYEFSSMASDFLRPADASRQTAKTAELFTAVKPLTPEACEDPDKVREFLAEVAPRLAYQVGKTDFKSDRMNREGRASAGLEFRKRQYNKRWRLLKRLEEKIARMVLNREKYLYTRYGKSALAVRLTREDLRRDLPTACFVAYLSARMSLRSVFTNTAQERPFDEVADALYGAAKRSPTANWWAMAHVYPEKEVFDHLSGNEITNLLGVWFDVLHQIADLLERLAASNHIDRANMIVRKGNDSSTWNQTAGAWNKARDHWIASLHALGMSNMLDAVCPGKVLRLMAADVVAWHKGDTHPDTRVWAELPPPWDVLKRRARCTRALVEQVCHKHGVKIEGWAGPKPPKTAVPFRPTPELVHGVTVTTPGLAAILRDAGWFSGKDVAEVSESVTVNRDESSSVLSVSPAEETES